MAVPPGLVLWKTGSCVWLILPVLWHFSHTHIDNQALKSTWRQFSNAKHVKISKELNFWHSLEATYLLQSWGRAETLSFWWDLNYCLVPGGGRAGVAEGPAQREIAISWKHILKDSINLFLRNILLAYFYSEEYRVKETKSSGFSCLNNQGLWLNEIAEQGWR